jgi:hypothetical protein
MGKPSALSKKEECFDAIGIAKQAVSAASGVQA